MLKDIAPKARRSTTRNARALRQEMTLPEVLLWQALRGSPNGPFILDFFCNDARLAIEVDGEAHSRGDRPERDAERDAWLQRAGVETLRIAAVDVLSDLDAVLRWITSEASSRLPLHRPAGGPPPRG